MTHSETEERIPLYAGWVCHLDVLSLIFSYRVEPSLLHLKVIDGKFKERPFCPIHISVAFLWTSTNTTVCWHFCLETIGSKLPKLKWYCALNKAIEIFWPCFLLDYLSVEAILTSFSFESCYQVRCAVRHYESGVLYNNFSPSRFLL